MPAGMEEKKPRISQTLNGTANVTLMMTRPDQEFSSPSDGEDLEERGQQQHARENVDHQQQIVDRLAAAIAGPENAIGGEQRQRHGNRGAGECHHEAIAAGRCRSSPGIAGWHSSPAASAQENSPSLRISAAFGWNDDSKIQMNGAPTTPSSTNTRT